MTGTLVGYMIYRLQDKIKTHTGTKLTYNLLDGILSEIFMDLDGDMKHCESILFPSGNTLVKQDYKELIKNK